MVPSPKPQPMEPRPNLPIKTAARRGYLLSHFLFLSP
jgi:hypothetical protein